MAAGDETGGRTESGREVVSCLPLLEKVASNRTLGLGNKI